MTVRFNTWIEADSLEQAWEKLRVKLIEVRLGDRIREVFAPTLLEDGEQDKEELAPLTVKELRGYLIKHAVTNCKGCFLHNETEDMPSCDLDINCPADWTDYFIDGLTKESRGEENERLD